MVNACRSGYSGNRRRVDDLEADDKIWMICRGQRKGVRRGRADIKEMQPKTFIDMFSSDFCRVEGDRVARCRKPTIRRLSAAMRSAAAANWR